MTPLTLCLYFFFFFQAEDGIRDIGVTGVQTCALPISVSGSSTEPDSDAPSTLFSFPSAILVLPRGGHPETDRRQGWAVHSPRLRHLQQECLVRLLIWRTLKHYDTVGAFGRSQPASIQPQVQHS